MSKKADIIKIEDCYEEFTMGKWVYKFAPKGKPIIIVSDENKQKSQQKMINEIMNLKLNQSWNKKQPE